jgi:hypothetical protein
MSTDSEACGFISKDVGDLLLRCRKNVEHGASDAEVKLLNNNFLRGFNHEESVKLAKQLQIAQMTPEEKRFYPPRLPATEEEYLAQTRGPY